MPRRGRKQELRTIELRAFAYGAKQAVLALAAALLLTGALAGCGSASGTSGGPPNATSSSSASEVALRVGNVSIARGEVAHWAGMIARSSSIATALGPTSGSPQQKALQFLISANWLIGEAKEEGLQVSSSAVEHSLQKRIDALPNGRPEFDEELSSTGQRLADVKLEVRAALSAAALRSAVARRVPAVTSAQVASYYGRHRGRFYLPDRRVAYLIEGIRSYAHAVALAKQVRPGERFTLPWFRELVLENHEAAEPGKLAHMVFTAIPGRVYGPAMFFGHWVLGVVKQLIPAEIQPLAAVKGELSKTLAVERRERTLRRFAAAFMRKWRTRTSCSPSFLVQKCSNYRGRPAPEANPLTEG